MRTILLSGALLLGTVTASFAQTAAIDPVAVTILNRMADNIGALRSCSFRLDASHDELDPDLGAVVRLHDSHEVFIVGPDKMLVNTKGDKGQRGFWYDGKQAVYYSYAENNYGRVKAPATIIEMIERIHDDYGVDFPAADFFYPTFVDDLIAQSKRIVFRKTVRVDDRDCFHVVAQGPEQDLELWIANDAANLPVRYLFRNHGKDGTTQYEGTFTEWTMNPELPATMFHFTPPPGARELRMLVRSEKPAGGKP